MKAKYIGLLFLASAVLAGCGGSSSSGSSATASKVTINSTNSSKIASTSVSAATQSLGSGLASSSTGVQTTSNSKNDRVLYNLTNFALQKMSEQESLPLSVAGATTSESCTLNDANSGTVSSTYDGTTVASSQNASLTFTNCAIPDLPNTRINGTLSLSGISNTSTTHSSVFSVNITFTTPGYPVFKIAGGYTFTIAGKTTTTRTDRMVGTSFVLSEDTLNDSLTDFDFSTTYNGTMPKPPSNSYSDIVNYTYASDFTGGAFTVVTTASNSIVKFTGDKYPRSGQIIIYGANSSALRLTVVTTDITDISYSTKLGTQDGKVLIELSTNTTTTSLGTFSTVATKTWAVINAEAQN